MVLAQKLVLKGRREGSGYDRMLRVGLVGLIDLIFNSGKKSATPLESAESRTGVQTGSLFVWRYLLTVPDRRDIFEDWRRAAFADWSTSSPPDVLAFGAASASEGNEK
jgi:hypothetical protein